MGKKLTDKGIEIEEVDLPQKLPTPLIKPAKGQVEREIENSNDLNKKNGFNVFSMKRSTYVLMWISIFILIVAFISLGVWGNISYDKKQYGDNTTLNNYNTNEIPITVNDTDYNHIPINISITNVIDLGNVTNLSSRISGIEGNMKLILNKLNVSV